MKIKYNREVKASDYYDIQDPRGMSTREFDDYMRVKNGNNNVKKVIMTQEQKDFLKNMVKFRALNPFDNEDYDNTKLKELRETILETIKNYKQLKKRIEEKKLENKKYNELLKAIDSIQSSE
jgi:hypothetical protein